MTKNTSNAFVVKVNFPYLKIPYWTFFNSPFCVDFRNIQFLGSMLPQYNIWLCPFRFVSQKKNLGHFEARYEVEIRYADCSHKCKIN